MRFIVVADAETRVHEKRNGKIVPIVPAGGVSASLEPIAKASECIYIGRGKTVEDKNVVDKKSIAQIEDENGTYMLKRLFLSDVEMEDYYYGFSNQTLWPLCHVAFQTPEFNKTWYQGYKRVNKKFADSILEEIKGKTFIWIHDYQLALVPKFLEKPKGTIVAMFWHIPWPTWEVFRILPFKKELLESLLSCDFLGFHRGYHVRNFFESVERELEARIDHENSKVFFNKNVITVKNLPLGIDTDVVKSLAATNGRETVVTRVLKDVVSSTKGSFEYNIFFKEYKLMIGVDRLDYTKGLRNRLLAIDSLFEKYPAYREKVIYIGIIAPSRMKIPSYSALKKLIQDLTSSINKKYSTPDWKPIFLVHDVFPRRDIVDLLKKADVCLVTPLDDGMNLVSKEFVIASSFLDNPGMLVLSQFAGSAIDLTRALIVNPYDIDEIVAAMRQALEMGVKEKKERIAHMVERLEEKNVYAWASEFVRDAQLAREENRG